MTPRHRNTRRTSHFQTRRPGYRPFLECLEDRLAPTITAGDLLVASSANALTSQQPQPITEAGLIQVDHTNFANPSGNESAISGDRQGFMSMPDYIVPDTGPNGGFYVADHTAFGRGEGPSSTLTLQR